ncbi:MAG TPA: diguanylate cyclase [Rhodanobacteraceae bacterium]|nr:diguanylate cyclase [Rhodanobacteraceae bacterium]
MRARCARKRVQEMSMIISGMRIGLTVSLGVAAVNAETAIPDDLIERADAALYRSKSSGRNLVSVALEARVEDAAG